jgi:hypothetical protein
VGLNDPATSGRVRPAHAETATWLMAKETGTTMETAGVADAAERVCYKLCSRVSHLVTPAGSQALLSRALYLSRPDSQCLERLRAGTLPGPALGGLHVLRGELEVGQMKMGLVAVVATLLDLLVGFIGEDLTMRLVREIWPDVPCYHHNGGA